MRSGERYLCRNPYHEFIDLYRKSAHILSGQMTFLPLSRLASKFGCYIRALSSPQFFLYLLFYASFIVQSPHKCLWIYKLIAILFQLGSAVFTIRSFQMPWTLGIFPLFFRTHVYHLNIYSCRLLLLQNINMINFLNAPLSLSPCLGCHVILLERQ